MHNDQIVSASPLPPPALGLASVLRPSERLQTACSGAEAPASEAARAGEVADLGAALAGATPSGAGHRGEEEEEEEDRQEGQGCPSASGRSLDRALDRAAQTSAASGAPVLTVALP